MTVLNGPCHSTEARGTLAGLLTFSQRRGKALAGATSNPKQPRTLPQRATRTYLAGLSTQLAQLDQAQRDSWKTHDAYPALSPYHAYMRENANRYKNLDGLRYGHATQPFYPTAQWPATLSGDNAFPTSGTFTPLSCSARFDFHQYDPKEGFLYLFHLGSWGGGYPIYGTVIYVIRPVYGMGQSFTIYQLPPGLIVIRLVRTTMTGKTEDQSLNYTVTILP